MRRTSRCEPMLALSSRMTRHHMRPRRTLAMNRRMSDRNVQILEIIEEADKVVLRNRATGKHTGEAWMGAPADGETYDIESWSIYRFRDGKIVESWGLNDAMRLMMQLGGELPQPAASSSR